MNLNLKELSPTAADITAAALAYIGREGWYAGGICDQDESENENAPCWLALLFDAEGDYLTIGETGRPQEPLI